MEKIELAAAIKARGVGRTARLTGRSCPYPPGSFNAFCWRAGYDQEVWSIDQLHAKWAKGKA
jgi:hypothetical protein